MVHCTVEGLVGTLGPFALRVLVEFVVVFTFSYVQGCILWCGCVCVCVCVCVCACVCVCVCMSAMVPRLQ